MLFIKTIISPDSVKECTGDTKTSLCMCTPQLFVESFSTENILRILCYFLTIFVNSQQVLLDPKTGQHEHKSVVEQPFRSHSVLRPLQLAAFHTCIENNCAYIIKKIILKTEYQFNTSV